MDADDLIGIARSEVRAFNTGDWSGLRSLYADDAVYDEVETERHAEGPDQIVEAARRWRSAFPDGKVEITECSAEGDGLKIDLVLEGTQSGAMTLGPGNEMPASNRHVTVKAVQMLKFSGGRIQRNEQHLDIDGLVAQIGGAEAGGGKGGEPEPLIARGPLEEAGGDKSGGP